MDAITSNSYAAPEALVTHCRRAAPRPSSTPAGSRDATDVATLITWLTEKEEFSTHDAWVSLGMAVKLEFGDTGLDIWRISHDSTVTESVETSKWNSFASEPQPGCVTLNSFLKRAHALGWKGSIRLATSAMFSEVAQLAAASGAALHSTGAVPIMMGRGAAHVRLFSPVLAAVPVLPRTEEHPELPDIGHPLRDAINAAIPAIATNPIEYVIAHAVINLIHPQTAAKVWPVTPLVAARTAALEAEERQALAPNDWAKDERGKVQNDNVDNVEFYLNTLGIESRWNDWLERVEIKGWKWSRWRRLDDRVTAMLRMHATKTGTRFVMGKEFAADALLELASRNVVDPAKQLLDTWQGAWDGEKRIDTWLCRACGVPDNAYYRAVSRVILLGLVGRIRHPGIKFDLMMVLISAKQGTDKSSLAKVLALKNEWFIENISLGQDAKELVLLLAGKTTAEVTEMRSRGDAEAAKAMISTTHDEGRTAYSRFTTVRARRNILIGSTNKLAFLEDTSGGRRFLPVHVTGTIDLAWVKENLPQLIGEAATDLATEVAKHNGEKIELPPAVWDIAAEYQEAARALSPVEEACQEWFSGREDCYILPSDVRRALEMSRLQARSRYSTHMENMGWRYIQANTRGRDRVWVSRGGKSLGERTCLVPWQGQVLGRVEMRVQAGVLK